MRIWSYINTSFRTLFLHRGFSLLTLFGLSVGIAMSIFVLEYVYYQFSYDKHYRDSDNIYRVVSKGKLEDEYVDVALTPMVLASRLQKYPQVSALTRIIDTSEKPVQSDYAKAYESDIIFADSSFFSVFSRPFLLGDAKDFLSDSTGIAISRSVASRLFANRNPIGETLRINETDTFVVRCVYQDVPDNSHFKYDIVLPYRIVEKQLKEHYGQSYKEIEESWFSLITYIYIRTRPGSDTDLLAARFNSDVQPEMEEQRDELFDPRSQTFLNYHFQKLEDIYLFSNCDFEIGETTSPLYVYIFLGIAFFILLVTAFNFMNLTTSRALERVREAGVRRIFGARRGSLVVQFISESVLFSFIALFLGLVLVELLLPYFSDLFRMDIGDQNYREHINMSWVLVVTLLVGVLSGLYPASVFSGIRPVHLYTGQNRFSSYPGIWFRGALVLIQVFVAVLLCAVAIGMWRQMDFVKNYDLGFDPQNLVLIERARYLDEDVDQVISELSKIDGVSHVSKMYSNPGEPVSIMSFNLAEDSTRTYFLSVFYVDCTVFETLRAEIKSGEVYCNDTSRVLINEEAASLMNISKIDGQKLQTMASRGGDIIEYPITGIVENVYLGSLKNTLRPAMFVPVQSQEIPRSLLVRYSDVDYSSVYSRIKKVWDRSGTGAPFQGGLIAERLDNFYREDYRYSSLATAFAVLVVIMASLGMTGLVSFLMATRRHGFFLSKIIGFRDFRIIRSLFRGYWGFVAAGVILALPVSQMLLNIWLETFSVHYYSDYLCFIVPAVLLTGIAAGIVCHGVGKLRKQMSLHQF